MTLIEDRTATTDSADELDLAMDAQEAAGRRIRRALRACPDLRTPSLHRDRLWLTVQAEICTTGTKSVTPFGSSAPVLVTEDQATDELISAMTWLCQHEAEARTHTSLRLFVLLRGVATRGKWGSARRARADALHGLTDVPAGRSIKWTSLDAPGAA